MKLKFTLLNFSPVLISLKTVVSCISGVYQASRCKDEWYIIHCHSHIRNFILLIATQLSKEDEAAASNDETEVRREDQDKINQFSRLHQRQMLLEEELKVKAVRVH